jgi:diguanylate cyclase (GGDEF)-like protein
MSADLEITQVNFKIDAAAAPKVLLVDDDEIMLAHLQALIEQAGFEVSTCSSATAALEALEQNFTPLIITDRNMPGMDGLELCRRIRARPWPGYAYLLLLTAQDEESEIIAGLDAGADDYLSKRMSSAHLLARLRTAQRILGLEESLRSVLAEKDRLSLTDTLTGAPNRRYLVKHLTRELNRIRRFGGSLCLLALDIDHFKQVNDRYGHAAGDSVLQEFVRRIDQCLKRDSDWCARMGGEEFAVVLTQTPLQGAASVAERIRQLVAATPIDTSAGAISITVSIGLGAAETFATAELATLDALLRQSDANLYVSKRGGRNRVTLPGQRADADPVS